MRPQVSLWQWCAAALFVYVWTQNAVGGGDDDAPSPPPPCQSRDFCVCAFIGLLSISCCKPCLVSGEGRKESITFDSSPLKNSWGRRVEALALSFLGDGSDASFPRAKGARRHCQPAHQQPFLPSFASQPASHPLAFAPFPESRLVSFPSSNPELD